MNFISGIALLALAAPMAAFAGLPHAFKYGGKAFADITAVEKSVQETDSLRKVVHEWTSPDGKLLLRTTETVYRNFPVREYLPELVAVGDAPTDIVEDFRSISLSRAAGGSASSPCRPKTRTRRLQAQHPPAMRHSSQPLSRLRHLPGSRVRAMASTARRSALPWRRKNTIRLLFPRTPP